MTSNSQVLYGQSTLNDGITSRRVPDVNGLSMHILEAGNQDRPLLLLLHGFPELAYSWRHQLLTLADAGFHVVAPDQRGYGLTTGWDRRYDCDLSPFRLANLVGDMVSLVSALGYRTVHAVIGHDFGSPVAGWCALIRPDVFTRVVLMSAPFGGTAPMPRPHAALPHQPQSLPETLAALTPPRKHYQLYYSGNTADVDMRHCTQGVSQFLREYYHVKSANWLDNKPQPLASRTAEEMARLPRYYVMDFDQTMAQTTADLTRETDPVELCPWLSNEELQVYAEVFQNTGFQGGLNWYRCGTHSVISNDLGTFAGRSIDVPACFIAGSKDWGIHQSPGQFERMTRAACTNMTDVHLVPNAGHWVQQEQPTTTNEVLCSFVSTW